MRNRSPLPDRAPTPDAVRPRRAALGAGLTLLLLYALTLAPGVTFWDAGEFATAFATFGIPHPPGTPLFVAAGRAWTWTLGQLGMDVAVAANLLSAVCTAAAGALAARLLARWTRSTGAGIAGALCAGTTSTVWLNATETEVYAAALLLAWCAFTVADGAATDARRLRAAIYALALSVPLHLSALAVAPAVALLAATPEATAIRWRRGAAVLAAGACIAGLAAGRWTLAAVGAISAALLLGLDRGRGADATPEAGAAARVVGAAGVLAVVALACTGVLILLVRARLAPALDQGHPATLAALGDVLARRQYAVAAPWPRQAPWWLQIGNLGQWADWQFALGVDGRVGASPLRTPITLLYLVLAAIGARWQHRRDPRGTRVLAVLLVAATLGIAAYLNLRAGPSFGWGVLPDGALREARERDYFFALGFFVWGLWAGLGVWALVARRGRPALVATALALAAAPAALNWRAANRRAEPDATLPAAFAEAVLASAPPRAVLLLHADNDSYPVWFAQLARRRRPDVTTVTVSLLGAAWYRRELAVRHGLLAWPLVQRWAGLPATLRAIAESARVGRRPLAASLALPPELRLPLAAAWTLRGILVVGAAEAGAVEAPSEVRRAALVRDVDTAATRDVAARVAPLLRRPARAEGDGVPAWAQRQLACPSRALAALDGVPSEIRAAIARVETACRAW